MKVTKRLIARHALTNTVFDDCSMQKPPRERRHFRLTWKRNTQLQMIWLWKWLESQSNCNLSRWKDKCLLNLLFCIPNFFKHFKIMVGEALPPLGTSLDCSNACWQNSVWFWEVCFLPFSALRWRSKMNAGYIADE